MKTALQEWLEWLKAYEYELPLELQIKANELLEKEKKQIEEAFRKGGDFRSFGGNPEYYNETYNQNK